MKSTSAKIALTVLLLGFLISAMSVLRIGSSDVGALPDGKLLKRIEKSPEYDGTEFANIEPTSELAEGGLWSAAKEFLFGHSHSRPPSPLPSVPVDLSGFQSGSSLKVCWLGHSSVLVRIDGVTILIDPVFDESVSLRIGHTSRFQPSPLSRDSLPHIDAVLISHDHYDHLERSTAEYSWRKGVKYFVPLGVGAELHSWGVPDSLVSDLDWWDTVRIGDVMLVCTPARHSSGRSLLRSDKTLWCSWSVLGSTHRLFYAGDSGPTRSFEEIGERFGPFDLTLLPVGGYGKEWPDIHLTPEEAVDAGQVLRGRLLLPVHWGTFDVAFHSWNEPIIRLVSCAEKEKVHVMTPKLGEVVDIDQDVKSDRWWSSIR